MKVANSLHQNQRSLNILSFEKALGYHLERQAHRHQSSWQSAGHYPKICSKKRWNISSGVILSKSSPSIFESWTTDISDYRQISLLLPRFFSGRNRDEIQTIPAVHRLSADALSESSCHNTQRLEKISSRYYRSGRKLLPRGSIETCLNELPD